MLGKFRIVIAFTNFKICSQKPNIAGLVASHVPTFSVETYIKYETVLDTNDFTFERVFVERLKELNLQATAKSHQMTLQKFDLLKISRCSTS